MIHYRATRPVLYENDFPFQQKAGYYLHAEDLTDAYRIMDKRYPGDGNFEFQIWDAEKNTGRGKVTRVRLVKETL